MKTINSNSFGAEISINNFVTTFNLIEQRNEIGSTHLLSNTTEYQINDNTSLKFSTRRNKEINLTEFYDLSYEYKNDCLTAALKFNKSFYRDNDLKPTEDLFFSITLIPLTTYEREIYKKTPGQIGLKGWFR
jgi:LPS-assembly protein